MAFPQFSFWPLILTGLVAGNNPSYVCCTRTQGQREYSIRMLL